MPVLNKCTTFQQDYYENRCNHYSRELQQAKHIMGESKPFIEENPVSVFQPTSLIVRFENIR